jgi:hypothetical protein
MIEATSRVSPRRRVVAVPTPRSIHAASAQELESEWQGWTGERLSYCGEPVGLRGRGGCALMHTTRRYNEQSKATLGNVQRRGLPPGSLGVPTNLGEVGIRHERDPKCVAQRTSVL